MSQRIALAVSFIALEALAIFVVGAVLAGGVELSGLAFPAFLAAELGGFAIARGLVRFELPPRLLVVAGGLVSILALITIAGLAIEPGSFPPGWHGVSTFFTDPSTIQRGTNAAEVYGIILLVIAWGRGVLVAQRRLERTMALRSFSLGIIVLVFGLLFGRNSKAGGAVDGASIPLVAMGLLTLTLIHLRDARPADKGLRGPWVATAVGTVAALVLVGGALGVLPLGPMGFVYDHALGPMLNAVLFVVAWALIIVAFPFAWVISFLITRLVGHPKLPDQQTQQQQDSGSVPQQLQRNGHPAALLVVFAKVIVAVAVIAIILYIAYRLFRRLHRPPADDEDRESLRGEGSLRADLAALFRSLRPRRPAHLGPSPEPALPGAVLEVRRLYVRLLHLTAERGRERQAALTPIEFRPQAEQVVPAAVAGDLTAAFVQARYGLAELPPDRIAALRDELHRAEHERTGG